MGGFVVNRKMLLKLHIDESNYITIPIKSDTKAKNAISKIVTRRNIPKSTQCKLYADGQEIDNNANLYEIMQLSTGNHIQIRFITKDRDKQNDFLNSNHHLIDSMLKSDEDTDDEPYSPYKPPKKKRKNKNRGPRRRAIPNKMNLIAFNKFSIQQTDDNDGMSNTKTHIFNVQGYILYVYKIFNI